MELDVATIVGGVAENAAEVLIDTVVTVLPIVLPVTALFWGIRYVLKKFGINRKAGI
jgi:hypothetical protein